MKKNTKLIKIILICVSVVILITVGMFAAMNLNKNTLSNKTETVVSSKQAADDFKAQAIKAESNKNIDEAIRLYEKAKAKYQDLKDTNSVIDMSAKIYILEHEE